jgi:4-amino-4-deoxy-L-arabinose transferase-like glycosyltransferase
VGRAGLGASRLLADGHLKIPSPPQAKSFLVPFVVDYEGERFGKYPPGWPAVLSLGVRLGLRAWVNPLLAGLGAWLTYRLGKRLFGELVGLLAQGLTLTSPFFLMNSGSLLSHPLGLVLSTVFALGWLDAFVPSGSRLPEAKNLGYTPGSRFSKGWLPALAAGLALGLLVLTRPLSAVGLALPFGLHGLYLLVRGDPATRRRLIGLGLVALVCCGLYFLWQAALTGDPLFNPYTLWWSYDKIGFGPGYGRMEGGHNLHRAYVNTRYSLLVGYDLFGWGTFRGSCCRLPPGRCGATGQPGWWAASLSAW